MTVTMTIRDVPDDVRDVLSMHARKRGQSLQAFLLGLITRQARFERNQEVLATVDNELAAGGGAGPDAPDATEVLDGARARRDAAGLYWSTGIDGPA